MMIGMIREFCNIRSKMVKRVKFHLLLLLLFLPLTNASRQSMTPCVPHRYRASDGQTPRAASSALWRSCFEQIKNACSVHEQDWLIVGRMQCCLRERAKA